MRLHDNRGALAARPLAIFMNAYFETLAGTLKRHAVDITESTPTPSRATGRRPAQAKHRGAARRAIDSVAAAPTGRLKSRAPHARRPR